MTNVYTCTLNLAIDLFIETETLKPSIVNRTISDDIQANGKGVNVSLILNSLGINSTALGFSAGFTGQYIKDFLWEKGIPNKFVDVEGMTRINVFTKVTEQNEEYKLVNAGPKIPNNKIKLLMNEIETIKEQDFLCVSGSFPKGIDKSLLIDIAQIADKNNFNLVIDTSYKEILDTLKYKPFLIKPNDEELASWFDVDEITIDNAESYLKKLIDMGAQRILLSLGAGGCIYMDDKHYIYGNSPKGEVVNTACSGDTLLGTFLQGIFTNKELEENLKYSIAAGSSTAFSKGLTDFKDIEQLRKQIKINNLRRDKHD